MVAERTKKTFSLAEALRKRFIYKLYLFCFVSYSQRCCFRAERMQMTISVYKSGIIDHLIYISYTALAPALGLVKFIQTRMIYKVKIAAHDKFF
jgi:hypothetical protein